MKRDQPAQILWESASFHHCFLPAEYPNQRHYLDGTNECLSAAIDQHLLVEQEAVALRSRYGEACTVKKYWGTMSCELPSHFPLPNIDALLR